MGSGTSCRRRIERRRLPAVAMKMAVMAWLQGTRRRMRRGGASWGRDGAQGCGEGARGWLWPRGSSSVAAAPFGPGGREGAEEGGSRGESERNGQRDRDGLRESSTRPGARRQAGGGRAAVRVRARSCFGARGGRRRRAAVVGWAGFCWATRWVGLR